MVGFQFKQCVKQLYHSPLPPSRRRPVPACTSSRCPGTGWGRRQTVWGSLGAKALPPCWNHSCSLDLYLSKNILATLYLLHVFIFNGLIGCSKNICYTACAFIYKTPRMRIDSKAKQRILRKFVHTFGCLGDKHTLVSLVELMSSHSIDSFKHLLMRLCYTTYNIVTSC